MKNNYFSEDDDMRPFIVKKMNLPPSSDKEESDQEKEQPSNKEQKTDTETSSYPVTNKIGYNIRPYRRKNMFTSAKPLFISILSAITIGVVLGFIILRIGAGGADVNQADSQTPSSTSPVVDASKDEEQSSGGTTTTIELEALQAYVLQAGVYSSRENTSEVVSLFESHGHSPVVWDENNQYFVFTHIFSTEGQAKQVAEELDKQDLETYAKLWATENKTIDLSNEDASFIQDFVHIWTETVEKHANHETDFLESWEQLTEDMPTTESDVQALITYLTNEVKETEVAINIDQILFDTWQIYAHINGS